ncbi:MAG: DUF1707 SHOCT-like domain-containing protein [Streptosporangiaceae bacterium]
MAGPGDEIAAGAGGRGHLRASHADREQAVSVLKAAFVQGRLAKDEFDLRIGQVLASRTYTELAALTADIPAGLTAAHPLWEPALKPANRKAVKAWAGGVAAVTGMSVVRAAAAGGNPGERLVFLAVFVPLVAVLMAVLMAFHAWLDRRAGRQSSPGLPPGAGGQASRRPVSADVAGHLRRVNRDSRYTAEAAAIRRPRPALPSWLKDRGHPLGRGYVIGYAGH